MHSNTRQALNASTRSVYAKWYWVNHGRLTSEQSCTRTLDRQRTIMHSNTRQALNASTRSVYAKWYWVNHGRLTSERQAHQRTAGSPANAKLTFRYPSSLINHSTLLLERSSAKLLVFYAGSPANNHALEHSTGSAKLLVFYASRSRRAVEVIICMITRDFSVISIDVTGVSLSLSLSLYYSQKSLTHNIGNASAFPIIKKRFQILHFVSYFLQVNVSNPAHVSRTLDSL